MTLSELKSTVSVLLLGDVSAPNDEEFTSLLKLGFQDILNLSETLHLNVDRLSGLLLNRLSDEHLAIKNPEIPLKDSSIIDLDEDLCYPLARLITSYISSNKSQIHRAEALNLISKFNTKVYYMIDKVNAEVEKEFNATYS